MLHTSSRRTAGLAGFLVAAPLLLAGCGGSSSGGGDATVSEPPATTVSTPTDTPTAEPSTETGGGSDSGSSELATASFDGDISGTFEMNLCTNDGVGSFKAHVEGDSADSYLGSVNDSEMSFAGPEGAIYAYAGPVSYDDHTFKVDGLTLTDELVTHQTVTVHGNLTCP